MRLLARSTYAAKFGPGLRRGGAPELPVGQSSAIDALLLDTYAGPSALLCPLPLLQFLPELGCQPLLAQGQTVMRVSRTLQALPFDQFPMELRAELLPQRLIILARFRLTVVVAVDTCNDFTEFLDASATAMNFRHVFRSQRRHFMQRREAHNESACKEDKRFKLDRKVYGSLLTQTLINRTLSMEILIPSSNRRKFIFFLLYLYLYLYYSVNSCIYIDCTPIFFHTDISFVFFFRCVFKIFILTNNT